LLPAAPAHQRLGAWATRGDAKRFWRAQAQRTTDDSATRRGVGEGLRLRLRPLLAATN
jgi:hypothetical protein